MGKKNTLSDQSSRNRIPGSIYETRVANLRWLIEKEYEGVNARLARALGKVPFYLSRYLSQRAKSHKHIGDTSARAIERAANKPAGWLDMPYAAIAAGGAVGAKPLAAAAYVSLYGHKMVPVLDYVQAKAWASGKPPAALPEHGELVWTAVPGLSDRAFALIMEGESMLDEFWPGDRIVIDPAVVPEPGDFVVAALDAEKAVVFAKYRPRGLDARGKPVIELQPLNDDYPTITMSTKTPGQLLGAMVEHRRYRRRTRAAPAPAKPG